MVERSSKAAIPPSGAEFDQTPFVCEYVPVRIEARAGQHSGFTAKAFVNVTPFSTSSSVTVGIAQSVSQRWSSVATRTMFGGSVVCAAAGVAKARRVASTTKTTAAVARRAAVTPRQGSVRAPR
jgi:hypothetical protein